MKFHSILACKTPLHEERKIYGLGLGLGLGLELGLGLGLCRAVGRGQECCMSNKAHAEGGVIQHEAKPSVVWCLKTRTECIITRKK